MTTQCPCGKGTLVIRNGKWSSFYGCTRYPDCTHTEKIGENGKHTEHASTTPEAMQARDQLVKALRPYYGMDMVAINEFIQSETKKPGINHLEKEDCDNIIKKLTKSA